MLVALHVVVVWSVDFLVLISLSVALRDLKLRGGNVTDLSVKLCFSSRD